MKFLALDGNSLAYRAFFALPDTMATVDGQVTNAVFGFCSMFANLVKDHGPDGIVVVFDRKEKTFRHERAPEYKAQREKQPDTLYSQLDVIKDVLAAAGVVTLDKAGYEGDDIIATLAERLEPNDELIIVTGDRDAYQLVKDPQVRVLYNKRGVSDYALYDEAGIKERTGVTPSQYAEYAALRGDPSDNLDGVPGVGEKTAAKLINTYGSLREILDNASSQSPKLAKALDESRDRVLRNAELMKLVRDVPIGVTLGECVPRPDTAALRNLFGRLEFSSMLARWRSFLEKFGPSEAPEPSESSDAFRATNEVAATTTSSEASSQIDVVMTDVESVDEMLAMFRDQSATMGLGVAWTDERGRSDVAAVVLSAGKLDVDGNVQCHVVGSSMLRDERVVPCIASATNLVLHDARNMMRGLLPLGIDIKNLHFDTAIASYLVEAESGNYESASVARRWLKKRLVSRDGAPDGELDFNATPHEGALREAAADSAVAVLAEPHLRSALADASLDKLYFETELPLVRVLAKMEHTGIAVDRARLTQLELELQRKSSGLVKTLHQLAGRDFNVNSTKQLAQILYEERGLTGGRKTKTKKPSTDAATLEKIRDEWPEFIDALLEYRETEKLRATYAVGLLSAIDSDGRIHASFNQTVARTGRLSSDQPNLHNIPIRTEAGRVFREVFIPERDHVLLVADYNQIELRCIAHLAQDPGLLSAFNAGLDIHRATAAQVFGVSLEEVTSEQRSRAKMVSYGLAYGMEAYGLAQRLSIDVGEAKTILDAYFAAFPRVKQYMEDAVSSARTTGYTTTLFGRRRQIEGFGAARNIDAAAARMAMNAGIQGLAADIFKIALVATDKLLEDGGFGSRLILQVHDEIIVEVRNDERDEVGPLVIGAMETAARLDVPLVVNASWGTSWAGAKVA